MLSQDSGREAFMYCVKCGVELSDGERKCPLCKTPVYYPGLSENPERPYPEFKSSGERMSPKGMYFIVSILFLIAAIISVACDVSVNGGIKWSGIAVGGILLGYIVFVFPAWFIKRSPAIFVPADFLASGIYLFYIDFVTRGEWFFSFAMPLLSALMLITSAVTILIYYLRCGYFYIFGGAFIGLAFFSVFVEYMLHVNFKIHESLIWSVYPFIALFLIGIMLIVIAIVRPFRESLKKIFAI